MGKQAVLGLGYQMGAKKFQATLAEKWGIFVELDFAQLIVDSRYLRLGGRNGDRCIRIDRLDLTVYALHHGFQFAVFPMEDLNELLGTNIIGKRPQTLAGAAGQ